MSTSNAISPSVAAALVDHLAALEQVAAERYLAEFVRQAWPILEPSATLHWNWHLDAICAHLDAVEDGRIKRLVINIPPGTTKSTIVSKMWPAKIWTRRPEARFLCGSYDQYLANQFSLDRRRLISSTWYQSRWPVEFVGDQNQKMWFRNTAGGEMLATSPAGTGTGQHPHFIVIDDPHSTKKAESAVEVQQALNWIDGTLSTRGAAADVDAAIVIVMQRQSLRDATHHVLEQGGWELLLIPMEFNPAHPVRDPRIPTSIGWVDPRRQPGELLDPVRFPESRVRAIARALRPHRAAAQLQQCPIAHEGDRFRRDWFHVISPDEVPAGVYDEFAGRYWDCAATAGGGDWTVGVLMVQHRGIYYVLDVCRGQWSTHQRRLRQRECAEHDQRMFRRYTVYQEQEPGSAGKDAIEIAREELPSRVTGDRPTGRKELRWDGWEEELEAGGVRLVAGKWTQAFIDEHCAWRWGIRDQTDDQIDAAAGIYNQLRKRKTIHVS